MSNFIETRIIHDPFLKKNVEISDRLTDRLRGKYAIGPIGPDGEPEFGWQQHTPVPIQVEAADHIAALESENAELKARVVRAERLSDQRQGKYIYEQARADKAEAALNELHEKLQSIGEEFGIDAGEERTSGIRRILTEQRSALREALRETIRTADDLSMGSSAAVLIEKIEGLIGPIRADDILPAAKLEDPTP